MLAEDGKRKRKRNIKMTLWLAGLLLKRSFLVLLFNCIFTSLLSSGVSKTTKSVDWILFSWFCFIGASDFVFFLCSGYVILPLLLFDANFKKSFLFRGGGPEMNEVRWSLTVLGFNTGVVFFAVAADTAMRREKQIERLSEVSSDTSNYEKMRGGKTKRKKEEVESV